MIDISSRLEVAGFDSTVSNEYVRNVFINYYTGILSFRNMVNTWLTRHPDSNVKIYYDANVVANAALDSGQVNLNPTKIALITYISTTGQGVAAGINDVLLHELGHAVGGWKDDDSWTNLDGTNIDRTNPWLLKAGLPQRSSYEASEVQQHLIVAGRQYTDGQRVFNTIIDKGNYNNVAQGGIAFDSSRLDLKAVGVNGSSLIIGGLADNDYTGSASADWIYGGDGSDILRGGGGADRIWGDDKFDFSLIGDDYLYGDAGNDRLYGGKGNDHLFGGTYHDLLVGGEGMDVINGETGADTIYGDFDVGSVEAAVPGVEYGDAIRGGGGNDLINGQLGGDQIWGEAGNDIISGGDGVDTITGGTGDDVISGDAGDDVISDEAGTNTLYGGDGADVLSGGTGNDTLDGGFGDDTLYGGGGINTLRGGDGDDHLYGDDGDSIYSGSGANNTLQGGKLFFDGGGGHARSGGNSIIDIRQKVGTVDLSYSLSSGTTVVFSDLGFETGTLSAENYSEYREQARANGLSRIDFPYMSLDRASLQWQINTVIPAATSFGSLYWIYSGVMTIQIDGSTLAAGRVDLGTVFGIAFYNDILNNPGYSTSYLDFANLPELIFNGETVRNEEGSGFNIMINMGGGGQAAQMQMALTDGDEDRDWFEESSAMATPVAIGNIADAHAAWNQNPVASADYMFA